MKIFMDITLNTNQDMSIFSKYNLTDELDGSHILMLGCSDNDYPSLQFWLSEVFYKHNIHKDEVVINSIVSSILRIWIDSYSEDNLFDLRLSGKDIKFFEKFSVILDVDYRNLIEPKLDAE